MRRTFIALALGAGLGACGMSLAHHHEEGDRETVTTLSTRDVVEALDGKPARATVVEVAYGPGGSGRPHRHPGPIFGYVLEGSYELGLDDRPSRVLKAGETFYEPTGALHRVSRNPDPTARTRVLAVVLHPRDADQLAVPDPPAKGE